MIYTFPEPSSPIRQGDIFINVPILALPSDELSVIDDTDIPRAMTWEEFAAAGESVSATIGVHPTIGIVGTQECDATRAPNITLFEVRPFREIEGKSKNTTSPAKWISILTQHARVNQKWFYLPADETIGFSEKMGADFLTPIRIPRLALERLINFRKGRLNEVASQHFRERLSEFFRRYAYDEWYPLTREELAEYQKNHPDAAPFPWQRDNDISDDKEEIEIIVDVEASEGDVEKSLDKYLVEMKQAGTEWQAIYSVISEETKNVDAKFTQYLWRIEEIKHMTGENQAKEFGKVVLRAASDMNFYSKRIEDVLPAYDKATKILDESFLAYLSLLQIESIEDIKQIRNLQDSMISATLSEVKPAKESWIKLRDSILIHPDADVPTELKEAANRQMRALNGIISIIEELESLALKVSFHIEDKFGKPPTLEDKAE